jgi:DNA-binding NarL/FixJ family response regulator
VRVTIADDSALFRSGLVRLLQEAGIEIAGEARDAAELISLVSADQPDLVIVDIRMPPTQTDEGLSRRHARSTAGGRASACSCSLPMSIPTLRLS